MAELDPVMSRALDLAAMMRRRDDSVDDVLRNANTFARFLTNRAQPGETVNEHRRRVGLSDLPLPHPSPRRKKK